MNRKPTPKLTSTKDKGQFPDFPPRDDMNNPLYLYRPGYITTLHRHFGSLDSILVLSEVPLGWRPSQRRDTLIPDLLVAFEVDTAAIIAQKGYAIEEQGKAPDFVLEVASASTGFQDEERKRHGYAAYGVREYWRFDPSGEGTTGSLWPGTPWSTAPTGPLTFTGRTRLATGGAAPC